MDVPSHRHGLEQPSAFMKCSACQWSYQELEDIFMALIASVMVIRTFVMSGDTVDPTSLLPIFVVTVLGYKYVWIDVGKLCW